MIDSLFGLLPTVLAHHPFGMEELSLSPIQGFLSGVGHPLLGPDHFLFLVALMLVGWDQPRRWIPTLLAVGLLGSALAQVVVIPEALVVPTEALVSLSLVVEGLVILGTLSTGWLYPAFALHGVMLGGTIVGAEPTPLFAYFIGLFVAQAAMLLLVRRFSDPVVRLIGDQGMRLAAGIWIGIGCAFSWSLMVA